MISTEEKTVVSIEELISIIEQRKRESRGIVSRIAIREHTFPSNITQRFQTMYKNLRELQEELRKVFSVLNIQNILIDVTAESKEGLSNQTSPVTKRRRRRDPAAEKETKRKISYQKYLDRVKIPGFAKATKPPAGFWDWYENDPANQEMMDHVTSLLKVAEGIWGGETHNSETSKRRLIRMLLSGFPYNQIYYTLDFLAKNPILADKYRCDFDEGDFRFLDFLRFEAFKNSDQFPDIVKEQFPKLLEDSSQKSKRIK